jgi:hypothetical protein
MEQITRSSPPEEKKSGTFFVVFNGIGVPIFSRCYHFEQPPLPILGLFSAIYTSSDAHIVPIVQFMGSNYVVNFRTFVEDVMFVIVTPTKSRSESSLFFKKLLNYIYDSFVMICGCNELSDTISNTAITRTLRVPIHNL